jgi:hypothetical protein
MRWIHFTPLFLIALVIIAMPVLHKTRQEPSDPRARLLEGAQVPADVLVMLNRSCADCHSNNTQWPWYSRIYPISQLIRSDVTQGRTFMNLSEWTSYSKGRKLTYLACIANAAVGRRMPPSGYCLMHGEACLSDDENQKIASWAEQEQRRLKMSVSALEGAAQ